MSAKQSRGKGDADQISIWDGASLLWSDTRLREKQTAALRQLIDDLLTVDWPQTNAKAAYAPYTTDEHIRPFI